MNVQIPTDQRINMSLDDLIKAKAQATKKAAKGGNNNNSNNAGNKAKKGPAIKANPAANAARQQVQLKKQQKRKNSNSSSSAMDVVTASNSAKAAKVIGAGKAKRNAQVNARRGLQQSATPTKKEIKQAINTASSGLKISFRPGELNKTTEKVVSQQIKAVLSRQVTRPASAASNASSKPSQGNTKAGNGNNNNGRQGPKVRGKNKVLRVKH